MMRCIEEKVYKPINESTGELLVLAADIGGTYSRFCFFYLRDSTPIPFLFLKGASADIVDFQDTVKSIVTYAQSKYQLYPRIACFAVAGPVFQSEGVVRPTNLPWSVDTHAVRDAAGLDSVVLLNDFQAIGYGIGAMRAQDCVLIHQGEPPVDFPCAIIGAGTGLGKAIMVENPCLHTLQVVGSEGGHADFVPYDDREYALCSFIKNQKETSDASVTWEDVLSGQGIGTLYRFLRDYGHYAQTACVSHVDARTVFSCVSDDSLCRAVYEWYASLYGRCAKNFVLDAGAYGGLFIAGGIAAKHTDLFKHSFFYDAFMHAGVQQDLLRSCPITVLTAPDIGLRGAAVYALLRNQ